MTYSLLIFKPHIFINKKKYNIYQFFSKYEILLYSKKKGKAILFVIELKVNEENSINDFKNNY
jgi:hypothetical protein